MRAVPASNSAPQLQGSTVCKTSDQTSVATSEKTFNELRLTRAYIKLLCLPQTSAGPRIVSVVRIGSNEIRIFNGSQSEVDGAPEFWMELFDHVAQQSIDSCGCLEIEDALPVFDDFLRRASDSNNESGRQGSLTEG